MNASVYKGMAIRRWPDFDVLWDLAVESQHRALDGSDWESFKEEYPNGVMLLKDVRLSRLDTLLCDLHKQRPEEFWRIGDKDKKLGVLKSWLSRKALTPPLVALHNDGKSLIIAGGNHRLAVARAKGTQLIPLLIYPEKYEQIERKLVAE